MQSCNKIFYGPSLRARQHIRDFRETGLQSRLEVRLASPDKGLGLFAREDIPKDTYLMEYVGQLLPESQVRVCRMCASESIPCLCITLVRSRWDGLFVDQTWGSRCPNSRCACGTCTRACRWSPLHGLVRSRRGTFLADDVGHGSCCPDPRCVRHLVPLNNGAALLETGSECECFVYLMHRPCVLPRAPSFVVGYVQLPPEAACKRAVAVELRNGCSKDKKRCVVCVSRHVCVTVANIAPSGAAAVHERVSRSAYKAGPQEWRGTCSAGGTLGAPCRHSLRALLGIGQVH